MFGYPSAHMPGTGPMVDPELSPCENDFSPSKILWSACSLYLFLYAIIFLGYPSKASTNTLSFVSSDKIKKKKKNLSICCKELKLLSEFNDDWYLSLHCNQLRSQQVSTEENDADYVAVREGYVSNSSKFHQCEMSCI